VTGASAAARLALLGWVDRLLNGRSLDGAEREQARAELRLWGFRKAARGLLLRRMMRGALDAGGATIVAPALGGLFRIACPAGDLGVGWEILEHGVYEPHVVAFYKRRLRSGMTVADVGANIGFHALHAASIVGPSGRVIAVEPDPETAGLLRLSLTLGATPPPVEVVEAALSDEAGQVVHSDLGNAANSGARFTHKERSRLEPLVHGAAPRFRTVRALRWDDVYLDTRVDFVKIDIEGFEPFAVRGMERSLERHRPLVLSEFAPANLEQIGGIPPASYVTWFAERGYRCEKVLEPGGELAPVDAASVVQTVGEKHHADLLFTPRDGR
jgi:FkbM family methyltransferase